MCQFLHWCSFIAHFIFTDKVVLASSGEEVLFTDVNPEADMDIKVLCMLVQNMLKSEVGWEQYFKGIESLKATGFLKIS